jgi:iron complex outermembrane receptor protein
LFGSLSPGGVINLVTEQPLEEPFYEIGFSIGNYSLYRPSIDLSGPLSEDGKAFYRLNAVYENASSFRDFTDIERVFVAPVVELRLSDRTNLTFDLEYLNDERPFDRGLVAIGDTVADIPISRRLGEPSDVRRLEELGVGYRLDHEINDDWTLRNSFRASFTEEFTRRFEPRFLNETTGNLPREFRIVEGDRQGYALRTEAAGNFATGSIQHQVLVGFDLSRVLSDSIGFRLRPAAPINIFDPVYFGQIPDAPLSFGFETRTDSLGLYVQDLITFTDQLKMLVGGRFDLVDQNGQDLAGNEFPQSDTAFSPNVGIVYQPIEEISLYGSFSRSFQPNFLTQADGSFLEPEQGTQYEVGVRGIFLDERLIANLSLYHLTKTNIGVTDPDNPDFSIPVGEQRSQGIELDVTGEILPGWNVIATYAYTDAVITEGDDFLPEGNQFINVPRHSASLWTTYELQSGDLQGLGAGIGLFFVGDRPGDLENSFTLPSYLRTDAAIYYRRENWRAALNFKNLFDVRYFESSAFGRARITPGAPFTITGSIAVEF